MGIKAAARPLTAMQLRFVDAYLDRATHATFGVASRSAEKAGYRWPDKTGSVIARHPDVVREIRRRLRACPSLRRPLKEVQEQLGSR